jgi:HK97 family phage major capsid protein
MNKRLKEIFASFQAKAAQARSLYDEGKTEEAQNAMAEAKALKQQYENEKELYDMERDGVPAEPKPENKLNGFQVMAKVLRGKKLTEAENALVTGGANGEDYLVPEDVDTEIREYRKNYKAAKELVTVIPTDSLKGSFNFESGAPTGLVDFEDGAELSEDNGVKFELKAWAIKLMGKIFPVSNILLGSEQAGLKAYLNRFFVKNAIISENRDIFNALKEGKEPTAVTSLLEIKTQKNTAIEPDYLIDGVIITNQSGFAAMDAEVDKKGRPLLSTDLKNPTEKTFDGLPIHVFSDAQLPDVDGKHPVFVGSTKAGVYFIDKEGYNFATSEHAFFNKNQTAFRVIEGYDVLQADAKAYTYLLLGAAS